MPEEVVKRTSSSIQAKTLHLGNPSKGGPVFKLRYAYLTQRGYYPDGTFDDEARINLILIAEVLFRAF